MPRLRILYLIDHAGSTGGAERFAIGLASQLPQDRFEPWLCVTRNFDGLATEILDRAGVPHVSLGRRSKLDQYRLAGLAGLLRRERFDVLHTHKFGSNLYGALIGRACRVPAIVAHEHSWAYAGNPLRAWVDGHLIGRLADRFVAVSSSDGDRMVSIERVPRERVVVIPTGYIPSPVTSSTDIRAELGLGPTTPIVAIAAVLRVEKRIDLLLEAFAQVRASLPEARLLIAGGGPCRAELEARAASSGLTGAVIFLGPRTDVDSVLEAADVGVLSSDREGSPLIVFECMASSTPIVATDVGGVPEIVADGVTGLIVPRRDPEAMAAALLRLLADPEQRTRMGAAARARLEGYTIQATAAHFANLYESLAGERR